jgi:hypothetical protein
MIQLQQQEQYQDQRTSAVIRRVSTKSKAKTEEEKQKEKIMYNYRSFIRTRIDMQRMSKKSP